MARVFAKRDGRFPCVLSVLIIIAFCGRILVSARSDQETRERFYGTLVNSSAPDSGEASIAKIFDRVLEKEFSENESTDGK